MDHGTGMTTTDPLCGLDYLDDVLETLEAVELQGMLYVDLKPANVMSVHSTSNIFGVRPVLVDTHGLVQCDADGRYTGPALGTADLFSPEVAGAFGTSHATSKTHSWSASLLGIAIANDADPFDAFFQKCAPAACAACTAAAGLAAPCNQLLRTSAACTRSRARALQGGFGALNVLRSRTSAGSRDAQQLHDANACVSEVHGCTQPHLLAPR